MFAIQKNKKMKNLKQLALTLMFISLILNLGYSQNNEINKKRYYIESGIIKYKISGNRKNLFD